MRQAGIITASLTVIRRQRDPELRQAVELAAAGKLGETISSLSERQRITAIAPPADRYRAIAEDYLRSHLAGQTTLVVSPAIEERSELNHVIRNLLVEREAVARKGVELRTLSSLDLTRAQCGHARHYAAGNVIRFRRGSAKLGIAPGEYLTVEASDTKRNLLRLRTDKGKEIAAANTRLRHLDYGYASTSHASQGATVDRVIVNIDTERSARLVNRRQFYVSLSRARYDARIYTDNAEALARAIGREQLKAMALENLSPAHRRSLSRFKPIDIEDSFAARLRQGMRTERKVRRSQGIGW
jgi:hypothetical protein